MSELKVHKAYNRWIDEEMPTPNDDLICNEVYLKYEADKVINHYKYKRCLAMASWCCDACDKWMMRKAKAIGLGKEGVKEYHQARSKFFLYMRWHKRWIKIAEQFKEAK